MGYQAGYDAQGSHSIAIGYHAAYIGQVYDSVAIGTEAGSQNQNMYAIAIGSNAGQIFQGSNSIAIGEKAGETGQGMGAIAIGHRAGETDQAQESIVINADVTNPWTDTTYQTQSGLFVRPIRTNYSDYVYCNDTTSAWEVGSFEVHLGANAGQYGQQSEAIALGSYAGYTGKLQYRLHR